MRVLVTGSAGFIGSHVAHQLLARGDEVLGLDNVNDYYDVSLKEARLARLKAHPGFAETRISLEDRSAVESAFERFQPQRVIHLAAQAGVRYSMENPRAYVDTNVTGFLNILEPCRQHQIEHLVYASSSSVYGANTKMPFSVHDSVNHPLSLYAATKKSNELMAHTYSSLFNIPTTGLRFFTVYGPWGRPDMALFIFTRNILEGRPIKLFNHGEHERDFTYIDDIVHGLIRLSDQVATPDPTWDSALPDPATSAAPYRVFNIGNNRPVKLMRYVELLEQALGRKAVKEYLPLQPGDVPAARADIEALAKAVDYRPKTTVDEGIDRFVRWYRDYYQV